MTSSVPFGAYQYEIYLRGAQGETPDFPMSWPALERAAHDALDDGPRGYVFGGAGTEDTQRENLEAFRRWRLGARHLNDVSQRSLTTELLGQTLPAPVLLSPVGVQSIIHPEGELAVARAAAAVGVPMIASTASSFTMEEIADANGDGARWYQLYYPKTRELAESFVRRAEAAGYGAIVVTLDTTMLAWRPRDLQLAYLPFLQSTGIANYLADPVFRATLERPPEDDPQAAVGQFALQFSNPALGWDDIKAVRGWTSLPLLLKGVLDPEDARLAREAGVDGLIVSNHGGRQVDGQIAALDALPGVVDAVGADLPILLDSGVRSGADVAKALALGARAVGLGRPYLWGLAVAGQRGVETVLRCLLAELDLTLGLTGLTRPAQLDNACVTRR